MSYNANTDQLGDLRKLVDQYENSPAKGIVHGFQKDLIQNSIGARRNNTKLNSNWEILIELTKIKGKYCIVATDKYTTGLTGKAYSDSAVREKIKEGGEWFRDGKSQIPAEENLTRFLNLSFSGGGEGPGSKGQGKGLYNMMSSEENSYKYIFESIQCTENDEMGDYLCGRKYFDGTQLIVDFKTPDHPEDLKSMKDVYLKEFKNWTNGEIKPLNHVGTRIIIYGIDEKKTYEENGSLTFIQIFKNSFNENLDDIENEKSLYNMIQETWWEVIIKKGDKAKFILKYKDQTREVKNDGNLKRIYGVKKSDKNHIVKQKQNIDIGYNGLKIKKLTFIYFKNGVKGLEQGIYINRRWMKIGNSISPRYFENAFTEKFYGYVELSKDLEDEILQYENGTHYGFKGRGFMSLYFNKVLREEYNIFKNDCGLGERTYRSESQTLRDSYLHIARRLNFANVSNWAPSRELPDFQIKFEKLTKTSPNWSMNYTDKIGPLKLKLINNEFTELSSAKILIEFIQENQEPIKIFESENGFTIDAKSHDFLEIPEFGIDDRLIYERLTELRISLLDSENIQKAKNTRWIWLGLDQPEEPNTKYLSIKNLLGVFPNQNTTRVNIGEEISNIRCDFVSNLNIKINCIIITRITYNQNGRKTLFDHYTNEIEVDAGAEYSLDIPDLVIDNRFDLIKNRDESEKNREVKIQVDIISAHDYPELQIQKGMSLGNKKDLKFFIEYNPVGRGPFSDFRNMDDSNAPKSKYKLVENNQYEFIINFGHRCWKEIDEYGAQKDKIKEAYRQTEIAKQAILLCVESGQTNNSFFRSYTNEGNMSYKDFFESETNTPNKTIEFVDELINKVFDY